MPVIKYREIIGRVSRKPVFGPDDLRCEGMKEVYWKKLLHSLSKSGKIKRIERGKYTCMDDPVAVAAHITHPSYLSLWTAMSIRHLTDQIPFAVDVMSSRKRFRNSVDFQGAEISFHRIPPGMMFGFENMIWKENTRIPVAKPEKIVIDAIYTKSVPEGELLGIIRGSDKNLLDKYAKLSGNKRVIEKTRALMKKCSRRKR